MAFACAFYYRMTASLKKRCMYLCMYMCVCAWLHISSPKFEEERKKLAQRHNLWNTNTHTHTCANSNETRARSLYHLLSFRWVGFFVKFAFGVCFVFARAICSCTANKVGRVFRVAIFFFGKRYRNLMEFFLHLLLASSRFRVFVLQVFPLLQHNNMLSIFVACFLLSTYCNLCGSETGTHCAF